MGCSQAITRHTDECATEFLTDFRRHGNLLANAIGVGSDDFIVDGLHLKNQPGLVEKTAIGHHAHRLRHLERAYEDVTLPDGEVGHIPAFECALVDTEHVVVVRDISRGLRAEGNAGAASESNALGVVNDRSCTHLQTGLIEPGIARLREGLPEVESTCIDLFPVAKAVVTDCERGRAGEGLLRSDAPGFKTGKSNESFECGTGWVSRAEGARHKRVGGIIRVACEDIRTHDRDEIIRIE